MAALAEPGQAGLPSREEAELHYNGAVAEAVQACAEDTAGQRCYICYGEGDEEEGLVRGCSCRGGNGFAHVSCLARGAQVAIERGATLEPWSNCGMCEQEYHGVVRCALGWACWKTYVGLPEKDGFRQAAMTQLGNGLSGVGRFEEASSVQEAQLSMYRRIGASEHNILVVLNNLSNSYAKLGRDGALRIGQEVYSGYLELNGEEHSATLTAANNYALSLINLERFGEAKSVLRKTIPVARRVLGDNHELTLGMRGCYAEALYSDPGATLDDLREAVTTLEEIEPTTRRVLGSEHPFTPQIEHRLRYARAALRARETPDDEPVDVPAQEDPPPPPPPPPPRTCRGCFC